MAFRSTYATCAAAGLLALALAGCNRPGPLSATAKGTFPAPPPTPVWAASLAGQQLDVAFPNAAKCIGAVDTKTDRYKDARKVVGWAWSQTSSQPPAHLAVVDAKGQMVGFGEGGLERPDVPPARPEVTSPKSGWWVIAPEGQHYTVYGLDEAARSACVVGELTL